MLTSQRQGRTTFRMTPEPRPGDQFDQFARVEDHFAKAWATKAKAEGHSKKHPQTIHPKEQFQNSPGRPRHPFHVVIEYLADGEYRTQAEIRKATGLSKQEVSNVMCRNVPAGRIVKLKSGNLTRYAHAKGAQKRKEQIFSEIAACLTDKKETLSRDVAAKLGMTTGQAAVYLGQMEKAGMVKRKRIRHGKVSLWGLE